MAYVELLGRSHSQAQQVALLLTPPGDLFVELLIRHVDRRAVAIIVKVVARNAVIIVVKSSAAIIIESVAR